MISLVTSEAVSLLVSNVSINKAKSFLSASIAIVFFSFMASTYYEQAKT